MKSKFIVFLVTFLLFGMAIVFATWTDNATWHTLIAIISAIACGSWATYHKIRTL